MPFSTWNVFATAEGVTQTFQNILDVAFVCSCNFIIINLIIYYEWLFNELTNLRKISKLCSCGICGMFGFKCDVKRILVNSYKTAREFVNSILFLEFEKKNNNIIYVTFTYLVN